MSRTILNHPEQAKQARIRLEAVARKRTKPDLLALMLGQCGTTTGSVVSGSLRTDGGINFGLQIPGSDPNAFFFLTGCAFVSGTGIFNGLISGSTLDATMGAVIACSDGDRISVSFRAFGSR